MKLINQIIFRNTNGFVTWLYTVYSVIIFSTNYVQVAYPVMSAKIMYVLKGFVYSHHIAI